MSTVIVTDQPQSEVLPPSEIVETVTDTAVEIAQIQADTAMPLLACPLQSSTLPSSPAPPLQSLPSHCSTLRACPALPFLTTSLRGFPFPKLLRYGFALAFGRLGSATTAYLDLADFGKNTSQFLQSAIFSFERLQFCQRITQQLSAVLGIVEYHAKGSISHTRATVWSKAYKCPYQLGGIAQTDNLNRNADQSPGLSDAVLLSGHAIIPFKMTMKRRGSRSGFLHNYDRVQNPVVLFGNPPKLCDYASGASSTPNSPHPMPAEFLLSGRPSPSPPCKPTRESRFVTSPSVNWSMSQRMRGLAFQL